MDDSNWDWGGFPSDSGGSFDLPDFNWDNVDFGGSYFNDGVGFDLSNLNDFGFDLGGLNALDWINTNPSDLLNWGADVGVENSFDLGGVGYDTGAFEQPTKNYLLEGVTTPGQGFQAPETSLYQAEGEQTQTIPGEGLKEPEVPGMTYMGGAQGIQAEVPAQYDENGNLIKGTGGYLTQMGLIPYDATPVIGDPKSFINDPSILGHAVFGTDFVKYPDGTTVRVDPVTGKTTTTKETVRWGGSKTTPQSIQKQLQNYVSNRLNIAPSPVVQMQQIQGSPVALTDLTGGSKFSMAPVQYGNLGALFPSENLIERLAGERKAEGGVIEGHNPEFYSEGGHRYVRGDGDGTSDSVPAMLARGEFVIPADIVSNLGNGDNEAGAEVLDEFMEVIRKHKRSAEPGELPEDSRGPLAYLKEAMKG